MSAVVVDMYRGQAHEMEIDDQDSKALPQPLHPSISVQDVTSFLANQKNAEKANVEPPKRKRTSRTYQFSERDIRRYQQARKEGRLRFPDLFMYHIQRPTEDVQREAKMVKKMQEQQETERVASQIAAAAASNALMEAVLNGDSNAVKIPLNGNAGTVTFEQHSAHHCDESMALKSDLLEQAGKSSVHHQVIGMSAANAAGLAQTETKNGKRKFKMGRLVIESKTGSMVTKKIIPVVVIAAAGFAGVMIVTSSVGIGLAVAIPCAAIAYGSIKLYEHCKNKKRIAKIGQSKKNASAASAAESAPLAKVELMDH
jgi:hypothetical protein